MITVVGEALIDLVGERDGTTFHARPGGSPYNVAIAAARLGAPTRLLARFARDRFGALLRAHARASSVDLSAAASADEPTTLAVTSVDEHGRAVYDFYVKGTADWHWREEELDALESSAIVHFGSLASWMSPGEVVIHAAVARAGGLVAYDPNVRPALIGTRRRAQAFVERDVSVADIVKASDEDLHWLYPDVRPSETARRWLTDRPSLVLVTAGRDGATAYTTQHDPIHRPALTANVVDTIGAGDSWMGSILVDLHTRGSVTAESIQALSRAEIGDLLDTAMLVASLTCGRPGADPPTADDVALARRMNDALPVRQADTQGNQRPH